MVQVSSIIIAVFTIESKQSFLKELIALQCLCTTLSTATIDKLNNDALEIDSSSIDNF